MKETVIIIFIIGIVPSISAMSIILKNWKNFTSLEEKIMAVFSMIMIVVCCVFLTWLLVSCFV